tara:strand:+ start:114 stop:947 length:834 start_codon:yes stop_codon:yes gene_type:complete
MAINLGNDYLNGLVDLPVSAIENSLFNAVSSDPTIKTALPAEAGIRNSLSFANIKIGFPTREGNIPFLNFLPTNSLIFPAYVTQFSDKFAVSTAGDQVYGRTDPVPKYKGVTRTISLTLNVPCFDANDSNENLKKINKLIYNLYPSYDSFKGDLVISSPPLVRVKFANLISNQQGGFGGLLGYITSFNYAVNPADGFYFSSDGTANTTNLFFRSYQLSLSFTVLHEDVIGFVNGKPNTNRDYPYQTNINQFNPSNLPSRNNSPVSQAMAEQSQLNNG